MNNFLKSIYAFGDSIIYGHTEPENSFMQLISREHNLNLSMFAKNGATVIPGHNDIITQIKNASPQSPDIIVFDGYTNDAYTAVSDKLGSPKGHNATTFDNSTFCGAFEEIIYTIKTKWPKAKLLYVTIHKNGARDWTVQNILHSMAVSICKEWSVDVADVFTNTTLDTRDISQMKEYIMGENGSHPNQKGCQKFYIPLLESELLSQSP